MSTENLLDSISKTRDPHAKELEVYQYLREKNRPVSAYELTQELNKTSGSIQATLKRCLKESAQFRIYKTSIINPTTKRRKTLYSANPDLVSQPEIPELDELAKIYLDFMSGELINDKTQVIMPLRMSKELTKILQKIIELSPEIQHLGQLFGLALTSFLKEKIPKSIIKQAREDSSQE
jgi:predicted transcriptional regulator